MVKHLPGAPVDGVQRCERCGLVLVAYVEPHALPGDFLYFRPFVEIAQLGAYTAAVDRLSADLPECAALMPGSREESAR